MDKQNLIKRILSAVILAPLVLGSIYLGGYYYLFFTCLMTLLSSKEFLHLSLQKDAHPSTFVVYLSSLSLPYVFFLGNFEWITLTILALSILQLLASLVQLPKNGILSNASGFLILIYIGCFISSSVYLREFYWDIMNVEYIHGAYFLFMLFVAIWMCDIFAYFGGSTFGKHKLYPKVSPKKSIEGAVSGFLGAFVTVYFANVYLLPELSFAQVCVLVILLGLFGQIGDLIESLFKRDAGVKDSGNSIPGHGGVLDRLDSFIFVTPVVLITVKLFSFFG